MKLYWKAGLYTLLFLVLSYFAWVQFFSFLIFLVSITLFLIINEIKDCRPFVAFIYIFSLFFILNFLCTHWLIDSTYKGKAIDVFLANAAFMTIPLFAWYVGARFFRFKLFYFVPIWILFEYMHLHWSLSWPWLTLGHVFGGDTEIIQWYEYTGVLGGTLWVLIVGYFFVTFIKSRKALNIIIAFTALFIPIFISHLLNDEEFSKRKISVSVIQPNLLGDDHQSSNAERIQGLIKNLKGKIPRNINYILLPEYTIRDSIWTNDLKKSFEIELFQLYLKNHHNQGTRLLFGLELLQGSSTQSEKLKKYVKEYKKFNAIIEVDSSGLRNIYVKNRYIPFQELIPKGFNFLNVHSENYSLANTSNTSFENSHLKFIPVLAICYESIYGEYLGSQLSGFSGAIFMFSNERFLNQSVGINQYFNFIRIKAIELRKEIARTSNLGYAAIVDRNGNVRKISKSNKFDVINDEIEIDDQITFYSIYGDYLGILSLLVFLILIIITIYERNKK